MKKNNNQPKKYPSNNKKNQEGHQQINTFKKNVPISENNSTIFNFFKVSSVHKSTSTPLVQESRQNITNLNQEKNESKKNYRLSRYEFYKSKQKNNLLLKKLTKNTEENEITIDVSKFILFNENFTNEINDIFVNNFIRSFKRYIDDKFKNEADKIGIYKNLNISKITFNKFIQQIFKYFITKYLLNTYQNLIYIPQKYMMQQNKENDLNEVGLLSYNEKSNIFLEYSPINLIECNLFFPDLCSHISKYIKNFKIKKRKSKPNVALLLYRKNEDFTAYINKIKLICDQLGYRLLIREDEVNKLMNIDKLKEINQNYIIGSLQDKNLKYLKILDKISTTEKWTNFLENNNIQVLSPNEEEINNKNYIKNKNISKTQTTAEMTQNISKKILEKEEINRLFSGGLTFIGHNNNYFSSSQGNEITISKESQIFQNYQQNILKKFNKRRNVILFVDNLDKNDDNIKYINQINTIIPTSKSPIIILTNNLSIFTDNFVIGNTSFHTRYIQHQIDNEGIKEKENIIYMTFLILYFTVFIPKANIEDKIEKMENKEQKKNINAEKQPENEKNKELEKELDFFIQINESDFSIYNNEYKNYSLEKIKKVINNIFIDTKLNPYNNELYSALITLSEIITIINNYEIDNILVYLKNKIELIKYKLEDQNIIQNIKQKILLLQNTISLDIEKYNIQNDYSINTDNNSDEDISKIVEDHDNNSFLDYEYGSIYNIADNQYERLSKNYGINKGVEYNKELYFYTYKYCYDYKYNNIYNCISNEEIEERNIEDHNFFQNYYNDCAILNHSDVTKINMILCQIIINDRILLENTSKFIGTRYSKRKNNQNQNINLKNNNYNINEKIGLLNKLFRKCPLDLFTRYINAHIGYNYYNEFIINDKKYYIPDKLLFYNYYNDYYLMEQIQSEHSNKYKENEEEEDDFDENDDNDLIGEEEEEFDVDEY